MGKSPQALPAVKLGNLEPQDASMDYLFLSPHSVPLGQ